MGIQAASSHVKRLLGEQAEYELELNKLKEEHRRKMGAVSQQFSQIEKVFAGCSHQKVWDHFTKAQRKNIQAWRKQLTDVQSLASLRDEEDMELSEDDKKESVGE